jgi:GNAT superfamily N-acetyltransferase
VVAREERRAKRATAPGAPRRAAHAPRAGAAPKRLRILPLTPGRWPDLERLFGEQGACAGCWCMWMRLPAAEFRRLKGAGNRRALRVLVARRPPGLLAYDAGEPVAWVAVAPRGEYLRLANSRVLEPVPGEDVWAAPCFFVKPSHRGGGLGVQLLEAAATFARRGGARSVEGYPTSNRAERQPPAFVYGGFESTFRRAGFTEVARRSPTRPILRRGLARRLRRRTPVAAGRVRRTTRAGGRG